MTFSGLFAVISFMAAFAQAETTASLDSVKENIQKQFPVASITTIETTPLPGIYMAAFSSGEVLYSNAEATYLMRGELYQVSGPGQIVNLTEKQAASKRKGLIAKSNIDDMISYKPKKASLGEIFVFTDVDCGYCRKLHQEVPRLNDLGITVHYLAWPRAGEESATGKTMRAVWCSKDQEKAMDKAKFREGKLETAKASCKDPIGGQLILGRQLGVRGTPAIYLKSGEQIGGYRPADEIAKELGIM